MKKYLIVLDLDKTLLNDQSKIAPESKAYLKTLQNEGHIIVIATGRPLIGAKYLYDDLDIHSPIITDNGGQIIHPHDLNFIAVNHTINIYYIKTLFSKNKAYIRCAFYNASNHVYVYNRNPRIEHLLHIDDTVEVFEGPLDQVARLEPYGLIFVIDSKYKTQFEMDIKNNYDQILTTRNWGEDAKNTIFEVYQKKYNKYTAIKYLIDYYQINEEDIIAFGDGINDLEMLQNVRHGVAMKNAIDVVKNQIKNHTEETNDNLGVIKYLQNFFSTNQNVS